MSVESRGQHGRGRLRVPDPLKGGAFWGRTLAAAFSWAMPLLAEPQCPLLYHRPIITSSSREDTHSFHMCMATFSLSPRSLKVSTNISSGEDFKKPERSAEWQGKCGAAVWVKGLPASRNASHPALPVTGVTASQSISPLPRPLDAAKTHVSLLRQNEAGAVKAPSGLKGRGDPQVRGRGAGSVKGVRGQR